MKISLTELRALVRSALQESASLDLEIVRKRFPGALESFDDEHGAFRIEDFDFSIWNERTLAAVRKDGTGTPLTWDGQSWREQWGNPNESRAMDENDEALPANACPECGQTDAKFGPNGVECINKFCSNYSQSALTSKLMGVYGWGDDSKKN